MPAALYVVYLVYGKSFRCFWHRACDRIYTVNGCSNIIPDQMRRPSPCVTTTNNGLSLVSEPRTKRVRDTRHERCGSACVISQHILSRGTHVPVGLLRARKSRDDYNRAPKIPPRRPGLQDRFIVAVIDKRLQNNVNPFNSTISRCL